MQAASFPFRQHVPRWRRILNVIKAKPRFWINNYPEIFFFSSFCIPAGILGALHYIYVQHGGYKAMMNSKPYYRACYEVRRPDDPIALEWRVPEEYPAHYLTNRRSWGGKTVARDYGWDQKFD